MHQKQIPTSNDHVIFLGTEEINFQLSQTLSCLLHLRKGLQEPSVQFKKLNHGNASTCDVEMRMNHILGLVGGRAFA
ncbi:unnamed protein product [Musa acuminata subsp. malaccensis]|uniref:(wild Malaysian banana) hypothetical protein n=1 Tax=Musa acuminata subsp. malaccensis TaxID=214687 RepID=A0A804IET2_MUSAM|nr:unnamed protein product [Musa acuminata subsp. malaccensis]